MANDLVELADPHGSHDLAHFLGDEEEEVDDVFRRALETLAQDRVPGSDADRTGVEMALPHQIRQPAAISGAVAKPNSSAPSSAPMMTSRPVRRPPSTCNAMRRAQTVLGPVSDASRPAPHLPGAAGMLDRRQGRSARLPPSKPAMVMWSARALATPAATVPTPTSDTSLTEMSAAGLTFFRS